jgi:uncharacterized protein YbjT (DUF2867 family)
MKIFLLGGTGRTGQRLIELALAGGHEVTAFVRSPWKLRRHGPGLRVVEGNPRDSPALGRALAGHEPVITALGPSPRSAVTSTTLLEKSAEATVKAMWSAGVERIAAVSTALLFPGGGLAVAIARRLIGPHLEDSRRMEGLLAASGLRWTIARPPRLVHSGDATYRAETGRLPVALSVRAWLSWGASRRSFSTA